MKVQSSINNATLKYIHCPQRIWVNVSVQDYVLRTWSMSMSSTIFIRRKIHVASGHCDIKYQTTLCCCSCGCVAHANGVAMSCLPDIMQQNKMMACLGWLHIDVMTHMLIYVLSGISRKQVGPTQGFYWSPSSPHACGGVPFLAGCPPTTEAIWFSNLVTKSGN